MNRSTGHLCEIGLRWRPAALAVTALTLVGLSSAVAEDRSFDGTGNNLANPSWGSAGTQLRRRTTISYGDGYSSPAGQDRPSSRLISNLLGAQDISAMNGQALSDLHTFWGQFIDHDIDLTPDAGPDTMPIDVPPGDPWFDPDAQGDVQLPFRRSLYDENTGSPGNPRAALNVITAYLDGSMVYGSSLDRNNALRMLDGTGRMKMSPGDLPPFNDIGIDMANPGRLPNGEIFAVGDVRGNENSRLLALHTLFLREHNRLCEELALDNPSWTGEQLFQRARKQVGAFIQWITYHEYLPALLGPSAMPEYDGYSPTTNAAIMNIFSACGFRFGHSQVNEIMARIGDDGQVVPEGNINLRDTLFAPARLGEVELGVWLKGGAWLTAQDIDAHVVSSLRNFLFGLPGSGGIDLFALIIQRGRDHGLPGYNQARVDMGLDPVSGFDEITSDPARQQTLEEAYGDVDSIDPFIGGLSEGDMPLSMLGPLFSAVLVDQFTRLRSGDRFWFENDPNFTEDDVAEIKATRLAGIIVRNTAITRIQTEVFFAPSEGVPLFADLDLDGLVTVADLVLLIQAWGPVSANPELAVADINGDGAVDTLDLIELILSWGKG